MWTQKKWRHKNNLNAKWFRYIKHNFINFNLNLLQGIWKVLEDQILRQAGFWRTSGRVFWGLPIGLRRPQVPGVPLLCGVGWCMGPLRAAQLPRTPVLPGTWRVPQLYRLGRHLPCCGVFPHDQRALEQQRPCRVAHSLKESFNAKLTKVLESKENQSSEPSWNYFKSSELQGLHATEDPEC